MSWMPICREIGWKSVFIEEFKRGSIFPAVKRIVVKDYPDTAKEAFAQAGFMKEMQDYVLYR